MHNDRGKRHIATPAGRNAPATGNGFAWIGFAWIDAGGHRRLVDRGLVSCQNLNSRITFAPRNRFVDRLTGRITLAPGHRLVGYLTSLHGSE
jgi:hypothetical protein